MLSQSPSIKYSPNYEFSSLRMSPSYATIGKADKNFEPLNKLRREREHVPIQYSGSTDSRLTLSKSIESIGRQSPELAAEKSNHNFVVVAPTFGRSQRSDFTRVP